MANTADLERRSFAFRYLYYDPKLDKEVKKGFMLPELKDQVTHEDLFEIVQAIANLVEFPENSLISGELTEYTNLYIQ